MEDEVDHTAWIPLIVEEAAAVVGIEGEADLEGPKVAEAGGGVEGGVSL